MEVWVAPRTMLLGVRVQVRPDGLTDEVRVTVPVKPLIGAKVIVDVAAVPTLTETLVGLAVAEKSATAIEKLTVAE